MDVIFTIAHKFVQFFLLKKIEIKLYTNWIEFKFKIESVNALMEIAPNKMSPKQSENCKKCNAMQ